MTQFKTLEEVFNHYGMSVFKDYNSTEPINCLWSHIDTKEFSNEFFNPEPTTQEDYSEKQFLKDLIGYLCTFNFYLKIVDISKWSTAFNLDPDKLPFPEHYLTKFSFVFYEPDGVLNSLVVPYVEIDDVAKVVNETKKQVLAELHPPFVMTRLFDSDKAMRDARINFHNRIDLLDSLLDEERVEQLKDDLLVVAISLLKSHLVEKEKNLNA